MNMKKYFYLLSAVLFAAASFALTSCSNDDDELENKGAIVGTWENIDEWAEVLDQQYIKFEADGKFYEVDIDRYYGEVEVLTGVWSQDGDKIKISGDDITSVTSTIKSLSDSKLILSTWNIEMQYRKVSNSVIDKYLK